MAKILVTQESKVLASDNKIYTHTPKVSGVKNITENGTYDVSDYAQAEVNVPQPTGTIEITTTEEYDVSQYAKAQVVDSNLEPQNIAKDVTILGVTGTLEGGSGSGSDRPYIPTPSEMQETETQDTIYMLYDASGYMCCPVFMVVFTECVCTIQKYNNTTLVSEYVESVTSYTQKRLQFSEEDSDYNTYNYIVIKLQGNITKHHLNFKPKFNGVEYKISELLEVSGKCVGCDIKVSNSDGNCRNLEYYSFLGVTSTSMSSMFYNCYSLEKIELDTSKVTSMYNMFSNCYSLEKIELETSVVTNMEGMFSNCYLLKNVKLTDTSKVTNMSTIFSNCYLLQSVELDTSKVTNMLQMVRDCWSLQKLKLTDTSEVTNISSTFYNCYTLKELDFINMKVSFSLSNSTMLSQSELVKILNNLAIVETTQTLTLGSTNLNKLTEEEKSIATAKGWTLA